MAAPRKYDPAEREQRYAEVKAENNRLSARARYLATNRLIEMHKGEYLVYLEDAKAEVGINSRKRLPVTPLSRARPKPKPAPAPVVPDEQPYVDPGPMLAQEEEQVIAPEPEPGDTAQQQRTELISSPVPAVEDAPDPLAKY